MNDYVNRTDWEVTDGLRDFSGALIALKAGKKLTRVFWNNPNEYFVMKSSGTVACIYFVRDGKTRPLWNICLENILARDWKIVE